MRRLDSPFVKKIRKDDLLPYFGGKKQIIGMFPPDCLKGSKKRTRHIHVNNNAPVLLVAHMDTVVSPRLDKFNTGAGFDDRLGVFTGHQLSKAFPEYFDLLITDYEESAATTAAYFVPQHEYNLVVELDREGTGFVHYELASKELTDKLKEYLLEEHCGTFSDICSMWNVKCNMINLGLGIYHSHSPKSGFIVEDFRLQIVKLLAFIEDYSDAQWPTPDDCRTSYLNYGWRTNTKYTYEGVENVIGDDDDEGFTAVCEWCGGRFPIDEISVLWESLLCNDCAFHLYGEMVKDCSFKKAHGSDLGKYGEDWSGGQLDDAYTP